MPTINHKKSDRNTKLKYLPRWPPINIEFQDLSYSVPILCGKKLILNGISGHFRSGQVTAILGASGAGKSTLLNILAGYKTWNTSANVLVNGRPRCMKTFRKMSRYIMQKDLHQHNLTVLEAMMVSADLKLGNDLTKLEKNVVIEKILDLLRLTETSQTMCHQLSGGEMKRLSIALELVDNPPVIFLDEPTTGLDDLSSSQCVALLRQIALEGRTIVCSIHTPSAKIFEMFDLVYAMAGGQCVYQGSVSQVVPYMEKIGLTCPLTHNPADFIVEVACGEYGMEYIDQMISTVENGKCHRWSISPAERNGLDDSGRQLSEDIDPKQLKCRSTSWDQFKVLYSRRWKQMWRDPWQINVKLCMTFSVGVLVGLLFRGCGNDATKALMNFKFFFTVALMFMYPTLMSALLNFSTDVALLKREHFNRWYKFAPYYWSLILGVVPLNTALSISFVGITYTMTHQPLEWMRLFMFFSIALMVAFISESMGLLVASRLSFINGMFVGPVLMMPLVLLSVCGMGYGKDSELPLYLTLTTKLSYLRFALEGLFDAMYGYNRADSICPDTEIFCLFVKPAYVRGMLGFNESSFVVSMAVLWSYYLLFLIATYFMIKKRLSDSASKFSPETIVDFVRFKLSKLLRGI